MKTFEVKINVSETHYVNIEAESKEEAEVLAEDIQVYSDDADMRDKDIISIKEIVPDYP
tara:strand:+ start:224 stop:400 length:177 start_codon:yes stop_codon:yes gene_type:complete